MTPSIEALVKAALLPCPFCGKQPPINKAMIPKGWVIECCIVVIATDTAEEAVTVWNTRVPATPKPAPEPLGICDTQEDGNISPHIKGPTCRNWRPAPAPERVGLTPLQSLFGLYPYEVVLKSEADSLIQSLREDAPTNEQAAEMQRLRRNQRVVFRQHIQCLESCHLQAPQHQLRAILAIL